MKSYLRSVLHGCMLAAMIANASARQSHMFTQPQIGKHGEAVMGGQIASKQTPMQDTFTRENGQVLNKVQKGNSAATSGKTIVELNPACPGPRCQEIPGRPKPQPFPACGGNKQEDTGTCTTCGGRPGRPRPKPVC